MSAPESLLPDPALVNACRDAVGCNDGVPGTLSRPVLAALALGLLGLLLSMGLLLYGLASIRGPSLMTVLVPPRPALTKAAVSPPAPGPAPPPAPSKSP